MTTTPARAALDWLLSTTSAPPASELQERFTDHFLAEVTAERVAELLPSLVAMTREQMSTLEVVENNPCSLRATVGEVEILLVVEPSAPHKIQGLRFQPLEATVSDARLDDPPSSSSGPLDLQALEVLREDHLVGLSLHVAVRGTASWSVAGWADLADDRALSADEVFPAYSITKLLTTVVILQLVGEGALELEAPVARGLTSLTVPEAVTVRHLLTHHGGLSNSFSHWEDEVPDLVSLLGPEVAVARPPGEAYVYSNAGFAVLGQLIADVTGRPYAEVVAERVLVPLGMTGSNFPLRLPAGVMLHDVGEGGVIQDSPLKICTVPSAGGLWSTAADLAVFGRDWATLLPASLASEALSPQEKRSEKAWIGYGFLLSEWQGKRLIGHTGGGIGAASSLLALPDEGIVAVTLTNRSTSVEPITLRSLKVAAAGPASHRPPLV